MAKDLPGMQAVSTQHGPTVTVRGDRLDREAARLPAREISEKQFQAWVVNRARERGWTRQFHVLRAQVQGRWLTSTSTPGVPDLWLLRPPQLVVLEVKSWGGKATPEQIKWIAGLQRVPGIEAFVVSPADAAEVRTARPTLNPTRPGVGHGTTLILRSSER